MLNFLEKTARNLWGTILFTLLCMGLFELGAQKIDQDYEKLSVLLSQLEKEKQTALTEQEELKIQINSESDPAWIELTLMRTLGMVPEGQTKYFFTPKSDR